MVPDVCKPYVIINFLDLLENPATRKVLIEAETLSYPALLLLQNPYLAPKLTGSFISEFAEAFPTHLDIVCCPWGTLLRGKGKGDEFTNTFQMALDVVLSGPERHHLFHGRSWRKALFDWLDLSSVTLVAATETCQIGMPSSLWLHQTPLRAIESEEIRKSISKRYSALFQDMDSVKVSTLLTASSQVVGRV